MSSPVAGIGLELTGIAGDLDRLERKLARAVDIGCSHAELPVTSLDVILNRRLFAPRLKQVKAILARHPLGCTVHSPLPVNLMDVANLGLHEDTVRASLDSCGEIGASVLVVHPGRVPPRLASEMDSLMARERDAIRRLADHAQGLGVKIAMENLGAFDAEVRGESVTYAFDPRRLRRQIEDIDHPAVCGTLDFGHGMLGAAFVGIDYVAAITGFAPVVNHLHVQDLFPSPMTLPSATAAEQAAYGQGDLHLPSGMGGIAFEALLPHLHIRSGTVVVVELRDRYQGRADAGCIADARRFAGLIGTA